MPETNRKAIIVGISGASSSGKTTLARLLRDTFPHTFILHQDDFYRPENELPYKEGLLDWDCAEALDFDAMERALEHIRSEGTFPPFVDSKEDQNSIGTCPVPEASIRAAKSRVEAWLASGRAGHAIFPPPSSSSSSSSEPKLRLCLVDGFLLFGPDPPLRRLADGLFDVRLFLTVGRRRATARRTARDGYVTLEGFWADPPGYVDKVVWPNYAASHAWLFEGGDVEGRLSADALGEGGILALPDVIGGGGGGGGGDGGVSEADGAAGLDVDMRITFEWAVETLMRKLEEVTEKL
ncbi:putative nicotinamide riboside kinase 1 [Rosellinia necatrix]|uniref:Putative nicotinamide riboside kinase 1 n=1 Tax=Rosellinia necatrix TaxID=77044 RepID=A0A1S7UKD7_ROSNE|nr:putative nicotinamide riboside kinase 1 [Rosellinia necatrix]